jgi:hypothetical protein
MRYVDEGAVIVGLKYKQVRNELNKGKSKFVISKEMAHGNQLQTVTAD